MLDRKNLRHIVFFCKSTITNYTVYDWLKQSCITKVFYKDNADLSNDDMNVDADGDGNVEYLFPEKLWNHIYHNLHCCFHCYTLSFLVSPLQTLWSNGDGDVR